MRRDHAPLGTSWVGNAGYRPYEGLTRVEMIENAAAAVALGAAALAFGGDHLHVVATFVTGTALFGLMYGWFELRRLRDGMELHVRELEGAEADEPPRLLLVPRGS